MKTIVHMLVLVVLLNLSGAAVIAAEVPPVPQGTAAKTLTLASDHTALLIMDYQNDIFSFLPEKEQAPLLEKAGAILTAARQAHLPIIYIVVRFREGYPEVNPRNPLFSNLKTSGRLREGTPGAEIHALVAPRPGEIVITKRRVGAFSTTDLETVLRAQHIETLVLCGISTSGVVLSTVRWAADMDYRLVVIADACADRNAEVHRVLTEKVFPAQASVVTTEEFLKAVGGQGAKKPDLVSPPQ